MLSHKVAQHYGLYTATVSVTTPLDDDSTATMAAAAANADGDDDARDASVAPAAPAGPPGGPGAKSGRQQVVASAGPPGLPQWPPQVTNEHLADCPPAMHQERHAWPAGSRLNLCFVHLPALLKCTSDCVLCSWPPRPHS